MPHYALALALLLGASLSPASVPGPTRLQQDAGAKQKRLTDARVKQVLIEESIAAYAGSCPCPYNTDRRGRSCGRRSAYSQEGGESPLCYPKDVTPEMVQAYRDANDAR